MEYSKETKQALASFIKDLDAYLQKERRVKLSILKTLAYCLKEDSNRKMLGELVLYIYISPDDITKDIAKDAEIVCEKFTFKSKTFLIDSDTSDGMFTRIGEVEKDEWVLKYIKEDVDAVWKLLKKYNAVIEVMSSKFHTEPKYSIHNE